MQTWLADPQGAPLFWLTAEPGVGKTAFAAWLAGQLSAVAVHFCQAGIGEKNDPARLVCSLAYQLSQNLPAGYGEYLRGQEVDQNSDPGSLFDRLLVQPLAGLPPTEQPLLIIIDGLDEAADPIEGNPIAKLLSQQVGSLPAWLRLLVTSRSHPQVTEWLQGVNPVELLKAKEDNLSDLRAFIQEALLPFNDNQPLRQRVVQEITGKERRRFSVY